jgi:RNase P/RNase MRP subunit p30
VTVASACERNWITFEFIYSKIRNKLTSERAANLVFVYSSLHLREKLFDPEYKK